MKNDTKKDPLFSGEKEGYCLVGQAGRKRVSDAHPRYHVVEKGATPILLPPRHNPDMTQSWPYSNKSTKTLIGFSAIPCHS